MEMQIVTTLEKGNRLCYNKHNILWEVYQMEVFMGVFAVLYVLLFVALDASILAFAIVWYVLEGKTLSAIARRRGLDKPWMAWVPVGSAWLLGCISDQYRYVTYGQVRSRRKLLAWLTGILYASMTVLFVLLGVWMVFSAITAANGTEEAFLVTLLGGMIGLYLFLFLFTGIAAVNSVFQYMAYYDLFRSCDPKKSLVFLLVGIFASYPMPFFVYSCRNKDLGMPPRTDAPQPSCE